VNYNEAIENIHAFGKFGSKLGLSRMTRLMALLGNPQDALRIIHVAGTNGKGSVCRYIYTMLQEAGYRTGIYTSPYLERFTERIEFDGQEITEEDLARYTTMVLEKAAIMVAEGGESATEFEVITAIGFCYFADRKADFLVLEVGLGGTGDSTNIVKHPEVAVITSISFDHMDYLGDTLCEIAIEKAGIIKAKTPVVVCVEDPSAKEAIRQVASAMQSEWWDVALYKTDHVLKTIDGYGFDVKIVEKQYENLQIGMIGMHQIRNAVCALTAVEVLRKNNLISITDEMIYSGMKKAKQTGRFEVLKKTPYFIIDGAHNEAGAESLAEAMSDHFKGKRILMVVGMLSDKKIDKILDVFFSITEDFIASEPDNPRKLSADELCAQILSKGKACRAIPDVWDAVRFAADQEKRFDVILFAGSLYLIGKVRHILNETL
jgi:dihydrofolate synthase/folylpolyglutamate synthase